MSETQTPGGDSVPVAEGMQKEDEFVPGDWVFDLTLRRYSMTATFAIVTGTGIGLELAKRCAKEGYNLLIAVAG
jgi:hypothetical protein